MSTPAASPAVDRDDDDDGGTDTPASDAPPAPLPFPLPLAAAHPSPPLVVEGSNGSGGSAPAVNILLLHGWTQNAAVLRDKTHSVVRKLAKGAGFRLVYASAPYAVPPSAAGGRPDARAWWSYRAEGDPAEESALAVAVPATTVPVTAPLPGEAAAAATASGAAAAADPPGYARFRRKYHGWESESRAHIAALWASHGPFTGVLGFSQGAVAVHQLLRELGAWQRVAAAAAVASGGGGTQALPSPPDDLAPILAAPPKWGVMVCGFPALHGPPLPDVDPSPATAAYGASVGMRPDLPCEPLLTIPSLHIVGEGDATVPPPLQRQLAACFASPRLMATDKGHAMPQRSADLAALVDFIREHSGGGVSGGK